MIILSVLFFITAILYSSVGFGGGSTYLALMLIWDIPYYIFPIIALFCNIIVVSGNSINYVRSGNLNVKLLLPYLIGSLPFAFFGASLQISKNIFEIILQNRLVKKTKIKIEKLDIIKNSESVGVEFSKSKI